MTAASRAGTVGSIPVMASGLLLDGDGVVVLGAAGAGLAGGVGAVVGVVTGVPV